jgi:glutathione S-transferase
MRTLYHLWLSPFSRKVRVFLKEKKLDFEMKVERARERRPEFLAMNPAGQVPVLVDEDGTVVVDSAAICEYLDEVYPEPSLVGHDAKQRAEVRRLAAWFDLKFGREVTENLVGEKMTKRFLGLGAPSSAAVRAGLHNIRYHLDYIGDVPWDQHPRAREWYARLKSRPSFRPLLGDHVPGAPPPAHYANLDF